MNFIFIILTIAIFLIFLCIFKYVVLDKKFRERKLKEEEKNKKLRDVNQEVGVIGEYRIEKIKRRRILPNLILLISIIIFFYHYFKSGNIHFVYLFSTFFLGYIILRTYYSEEQSPDFGKKYKEKDFEFLKEENQAGYIYINSKIDYWTYKISNIIFYIINLVFLIVVVLLLLYGGWIFLTTTSPTTIIISLLILIILILLFGRR